MLTSLTTKSSKTVGVSQPAQGCRHLLGLSGRAGRPPCRATFSLSDLLWGLLCVGCSPEMPVSTLLQPPLMRPDNISWPCHGEGRLVLCITYTIFAEALAQS